MSPEAVQIVGWRRCSRGTLLGGTALRAAALLVLAAPANAQLAAGAHPTGGAVVGGSASITQSGNTTDITQTSGRAAIDWQSFNVGSVARVVFAQPSSSAVALNTVVGPSPSEIAGRITANGVVAIVNQSGVIFDQGSQVDTAGLVVSAAGITRQNFMSGHMVFNQAAHAGARVVNNGAITIRQAGLAALVAPQVVNNGLITAKLGRVILGGAATYTLDLYGDGLLALNVTSQVTQVSLGGRTIPALVTNAGTILADGGTVVLNASAADGLIRTLIESGGTVQANSVGTQVGRVVVEGIGGSVDIAGAVSATGNAPGTVGGTIVANATGTVTLLSSARVNASGSAGGGLVAIGTTAARAASRSAHATLTARAVNVAAGAQIAANATAQGNGGQVTLLSTGSTSLGGAITVMGGALGGDGGAVEESGDTVSLTGVINARAPSGQTGSLLIDPTGTVYIADKSPTLGAHDSFLNDATLTASGASVTVSAGVDVDFAYATGTNSATNKPVTNLLDIGNSSLAATAGRNINIDDGFTISAGAVTLVSTGGAINFDSDIGKSLGLASAASTTPAILSGSVVTMSATTGIGLANATVTGTTSLNMTTTGAGIASGGSLTTGSLTASAATSINLLGTDVITDTGSVVTTGIVSTGIAIDNAGALTIGGAMTASAGNILLTTAGKLTLDGEITALLGTVSLTTSAGDVLEAAGSGGGISANLLTGSIAGSAQLLGANTFATLSAFSANGTLQLADGALTVAGDNSAGGSLSITVPALTVASGGTVSAPGFISLRADNFLIAGSVTTTAAGGVVDIARDTAGALTLDGVLGNFGTEGLAGISTGTLSLGSLDGSTTAINIAQNIGSTGLALGLFASGPITETSTSVIIAASLTGGATGNVTLNGPNAISTIGSFSSTGGSLAFINGGALNLDGALSASTAISVTVTGSTANTLGLGGTILAGTVTLTSPDSITQTAGDVDATVFAATSSGGAIDLGLPANQIAIVTTMNAHGAVTLDNSAGVQIAGPISGTAISLTANGTITQGSGDAISGTSLTGSASSFISLATATNSFTTLDSLTAGGAITLADEAVLSVAGTVSATGGTVGITTTGAGALTIGAGISGTGVSLNSAGGLALGAAIDVPGGLVSLTAGGSINQSAGIITAQSLAGSATSGTVALNSSNAIGTVTSFTTESFALTNSGTLAVAGPLTASTGGITLSAAGISVTGTLDASSGTVSLTSPGSTIAESGQITATSLTGSAGGAVSLDGTNIIGALGSFSVTSGGFSLFDTGSPHGTLQVTGLVKVTGDAPLILRAPTLTVTAAGALAAGATTSGGTIGLETDALSLKGSVTTGADGVVGFDLIDSGTLSLGSADFPTFTTVSTGTLSIGSPDGIAADASGAVTSISVAGSYGVPHALALFAGTGGSITETASAIISATSLSGSAGMDISLAGTGNLIGTLAGVTAGHLLSVDDSEALTIGGTGAVSSGGVLSLTVTGGTLSVAAGATLGIASNSVTLTSDTGISEAATGSIVAQSVSGTAPAISLTGVNAIATLTNLTATTGALTIDDAPASATPTVSVTGSVGAATSVAITLSGSASTLDLAGALSGATVALAAPAGIGQTSAGISATTLTADSSLGSVSLTSGANTIGTLGSSTTQGNFALTDDSLASPGTLVVAGPVTVGSLATLVLRAPAIATAGELSAPGGTIVLESDSNTLGAPVTTGAGQGVVSIDSFSGSTLTVAGNFTDITTGILALGSLNGTSASGDISTITITGLDLGSTAPTLGLFTTPTGVVSASGITVTTLIGNAGTVSITGANSITTLGNFTAASFLLDDGRNLSSAGTLATHVGVAINDAGHLVTVGGSIEAGTVSIAAGDISIGGSIGGTTGVPLQTLTLQATSSGTATGTIAASGTIDAGTLTGRATASALFTVTAGNSITKLGSVSTGGDFTLEDDVSPTIAGPLSVGGALDIHGENSGGTAGDLILDSSITAASASFDSGAGIVQTGGVVQITGDLSLQAGNGIIQVAGASLVSGATLSLRAAGAAPTSAGGTTSSGISLAGTVSAATLAGDAANGGAIIDQAAGNSVTTLGSFSTGGNFTLEDDVSPFIAGPLVIGGALDIHGPNGSGTSGDLILDADISAGSASFDSGGGIVQLGGTVETTGNLTLLAANSILQFEGDAVGAAVLKADSGTLSLAAGGATTSATGTVSSGVTLLSVSGISFAGTLASALPAGLTVLTASGGNIEEDPTSGKLLAGDLAGAATAGLASFDPPSGNSVTTLGSFSTGGNFTLEDDVSPFIAGPLVIGGALDIHGPNGSGTSGDLILDADISAGSASFDSGGGIVQLGGTVETTGNLTLLAANSILQFEGDAVGAAVLKADSGTLSLAAGGATTSATGTVSSGVTLLSVSGISFAGTLASALPAGLTVLTASGGNIEEDPTSGKLLAGDLAGAATAGLASFDPPSGNSVTTLGSFSTGGNFTLEDDVSPFIAGPLVIGGALDIHGPNGSGTSGDLILDADISAGSASFDSGGGIVQRGGTVETTGNLTLLAANSILQFEGDAVGAAVLKADSGTLSLAAGGATTSATGTVSSGVTLLSVSGISFAGTLASALPAGLTVLTASGGNIEEDPTSGKLLAGDLAGAATAGLASFDPPSGNSITTLGSFSTGGNFTLEDDISPFIAGPLVIGGALDIHGPNGSGTSGDLILDADISAGSASFDSGGGIVQLGGTVETTGNLTLLAANSILQFEGDAVGAAVLKADSGTLSLAVGGATTSATGTVSSGVTLLSVSGISFAGTLASALPAGLTVLTASGGNIEEDPTSGKLLAGDLAGAAMAGLASFDPPSGNSVTTLGSFSTGGNFTLEDDVSPFIAGPLVIGGALDIHGPNGSGTSGDLILDADISAGSASFDSGGGIVQLGGTVQAGGNLTLTAANGIVQNNADANGDAVLEATGALALRASGAGTTTSDGVSTTGISISGTLMAFPVGLVNLATLNGDIIEQSSGKLVAGTLTGSSLGTGAVLGQSVFDVSSGNTINLLADYSTRNTLGSSTGSSGLTLEDDVSPEILGTLSIGGSLAIRGPGINNGTGPGMGEPNTDFTLDAFITADGPISFDSDVGIVQLAGRVELTVGNIALIASNGIVQLAGTAPNASVLVADQGNLFLTAGGASPTSVVTSSVTAGTITTTGIAFGGTLSAASPMSGQGAVSIVALAGDITEYQGARVIAQTLTGSAVAGGDGVGEASLGITATAGFGNDIATLGSFTTDGKLIANAGNFVLEDDVLPTVAGPVNVSGNMSIFGPTPSGGGGGGGGGTTPVPGQNDLILDGPISVGGSLDYDSDAGIVQFGGAIQTGGNLTLSAAKGILQFAGDANGASALQSTGGNLVLQADGDGSITYEGTVGTAPGTLSASGIAFAGTLSATSLQTGAGTVSLVASAGDIVESQPPSAPPSGRLLATVLTGSSNAGQGFAGQSLFDVASGNSVATLGSYTTRSAPGTFIAGFTLEDDISPSVIGPVSTQGSITLYGPLSIAGARTGTAGDLTLAATITAGGTASSILIDSAGGIIQLGGTVTAGDNLTLDAGNGIIQAANGTVGTLVLPSVLVAQAGNVTLDALGGAATTASGVMTTGISFAGTLAATSPGTLSAGTLTGQGTVSLTTGAGDILEQSTGQLSATVLTGSAAANGTVAAGQALFDVASGNSVGTLAAFTTGADFILEDDISPSVTGPVSTADGSITIYGPSVSGTRTGTAGDLTLAGDITAGGTAGSILIDSAGGIIQLGGDVMAGGNLTLDAGNGIIQFTSNAAGASILQSVAGNILLQAGGAAATTATGTLLTVTNGAPTLAATSLSAQGITFAGTVSSADTISAAAGTTTLVAEHGNIAEGTGGMVIADSLTGSSTAVGTLDGDATLNVASGNDIAIIGSFTAAGSLLIEDDVHADITGPIDVGNDFSVFGPTISVGGGGGGGVGGPPPVGGFTDLILDASITVGGAASFGSSAGIVQLGGALRAGGDVTLDASNGILQFTGDGVGAALLQSTGGDLILQAGGGAVTTSPGTLGMASQTLSASGIAFAGTLAAQGTVSLVASGGDIVEQSTGQLSATVLTGSSTAGQGFAGQSLFDVASGNSVATLGSYTTRSAPGTFIAGFTLEDDISPSVIGPVSTQGSITLYGPLSIAGARTGTAGDLTLAATITAGGTASSILIDSAGGIIQLGGTVTAGDNLTLDAGNGIIQAANGTVGTLVLPSVLVAQAGNVTLDALGGAATTSSGVTTTGISFAGTLAATSPGTLSAGTLTGQGTVSLTTGAGDILEQSTGQLSATVLTGSAAANGTVAAGQALFDVASGNSVGTLAAFTTGADFILEDDISPSVTGPVSTADGSVTIYGPSVSGTRTGTAGDLTLAGDITAGGTAGSILIDSAGGIIQLGGDVMAGGDLTLAAGDGIIQAASGSIGGVSLPSVLTAAGNLSLDALGGTATVSSGVTASGIAFAGTLSAVSGTVSLVAKAGDIIEASTGQLLAGTLTGTSAAGGSSAGQTLFDVASGNAVDTILSFATSGDFILEDNVSPTVGGPLTAGGSIAIAGANGGGTVGDIVLLGGLDAKGGTLSLNSAGGIVQQGGTAQAATGLSFAAGNGIIQFYGDAPAVLLSGGTVSLVAAGAGTTTASGTLASGVAALSTSGIVLSGTVTAPATSLVADAGSITGTGSAVVSATTLTGSASGSAVLTGANIVATLGSFTSTGFTFNDTVALTIAGPLDGGPSATIAAPSLTVPGTITTDTLNLTIAGPIAESGSIDATLLEGNAAGSASFAGSNSIGTLGGFTAPSLVLDDAAGLVVAGSVTASTTAIDAATIDIPGSIDAAASLSLTASGSLSETGSILAGLLDISAVGSASLTGSNSIGTLGNVTAAGLTFYDNSSVTVSGAVVTGPTFDLQVAGNLVGPGSISASLMTGSVGGFADFAGANQILGIGDFSTGGSFTLQDLSGVVFSGALNALSGNIAITAAEVTVQSTASIVTGAKGASATLGTIALASPGTMTLGGLIDAPTIIVGDKTDTPTLVTFANTTVITGTSVAPGTSKPPFPPANGSRPGIYVLANDVLQTGTMFINPNGRASTIEISLAKRNGTVTFDPSYSGGLVAPRSELFLDLNFGTASGHIDVAGLNIEFLQPGSNTLTDLFGTIDNESGQAAAGAAYIVQPNSEYRFNSCPIGSINCILISPVLVPITNPVEDVEVTTPRRRRDDDDLIIPNVGEQDF